MFPTLLHPSCVRASSASSSSWLIVHRCARKAPMAMSMTIMTTITMTTAVRALLPSVGTATRRPTPTFCCALSRSSCTRFCRLHLRNVSAPSTASASANAVMVPVRAPRAVRRVPAQEVKVDQGGPKQRFEAKMIARSIHARPVKTRLCSAGLFALLVRVRYERAVCVSYRRSLVRAPYRRAVGPESSVCRGGDVCDRRCRCMCSSASAKACAATVRRLRRQPMRSQRTSALEAGRCGKRTPRRRGTGEGRTAGRAGAGAKFFCVRLTVLACRRVSFAHRRRSCYSMNA